MLEALDALCYLDDIAHGRKMSLDPHELKLIIEKELKAWNFIKRISKDFIELNEIKLPHINAIHYEVNLYHITIYVPKEKYDLLKEVLL